MEMSSMVTAIIAAGRDRGGGGETCYVGVPGDVPFS